MRPTCVLGLPALLLLSCGGELPMAPAPPASPEGKCAATSEPIRLGSDASVPPVIRGGIAVRAGQRGCLLVDPSAPQGVSSQKHIESPLNGLDISVGHTEQGTMMTIKNNSEFVIHYGAGLRMSADSEWQPTSVLPLGAGMAGFELWPERVEAVLIYDVRAR